MIVCRNRICDRYTPDDLPLINRQRVITRLMAEGMKPKEIAEFLGYNEKTVRLHLLQAVDALGCKNVMQLIVIAAKYGVVTCPPFPRRSG